MAFLIQVGAKGKALILCGLLWRSIKIGINWVWEIRRPFMRIFLIWLNYHISEPEKCLRIYKKQYLQYTLILLKRIYQNFRQRKWKTKIWKERYMKDNLKNICSIVNCINWEKARYKHERKRKKWQICLVQWLYLHDSWRGYSMETFY